MHFLTNDVPTVAGPGNLKPLLLPALIIGIFVLVGLGMLSWGLRMLFKKGGYFVGTPTRLVHFRNGTIRSIDWEQFSGDIEVSGNEQKGNISLGMRTGKMVSQKNGPDRYVPDTIYISGIQDVYKVEQSAGCALRKMIPHPHLHKSKIPLFIVFHDALQETCKTIRPPCHNGFFFYI